MKQVFQADSPVLGQLLYSAEWPGREFAYARQIVEVAQSSTSVQPQVSIILCLYRPHKAVIVGLRLLMDACGSAVRLVVVNPCNDSPEATMLCKFANACITVCPDCSIYMARNIGTLYANAPVCIFLSEQLRPEPKLPLEYLNVLAPEGIVAARGRILGGQDIQGAVFHRLDRGNLAHTWALDLDENMAVRTNIFHSLGGFDETLPQGYGALDLSARIFRALPGTDPQRYCPKAIAKLTSPETVSLVTPSFASSWTAIDRKYGNNLLGYCIYWESLFRRSLAGIKERGKA